MEKQEAEAATVYNLVGETIAMPTDVEAAESQFYKDEYTLTWTFGDREVSGETIALTAEDMGTETVGKESLLVCTAAKTADGSDEHVVYEKAYTVYKIREEQLEPLYVSGASDSVTWVTFGTHNLETDGNVVSVMDGDTLLKDGWLHESGEYYCKQAMNIAMGTRNLVIRSEKKIVYQTIYRAYAFITTGEDFIYYRHHSNTNLESRYFMLKNDITLDASTQKWITNVGYRYTLIESNKVNSNWASTCWVSFKHTLDGLGHSFNVTVTNDMHWGIVTYKAGVMNPFTGIFENLVSGAGLKNINFNLDITLPGSGSRIIGNVNEGATIENCVFNINANNNIYNGVGSTEDYGGKLNQWGEAIFGTCAGTVKDSLFINTGLNNYRFALNSAAHVENCVVVNVSSTGTVNNNNGVAQLFFPVTANENTKFWLYDTLANAISGTFANVSGYATATADGAATFVQENAKPLAEIFADSAYLTVKDGAAYWNGVAI